MINMPITKHVVCLRCVCHMFLYYIRSDKNLCGNALKIVMIKTRWLCIKVVHIDTHNKIILNKNLLMTSYVKTKQNLTLKS
jgi:hypothetical protein